MVGRVGDANAVQVSPPFSDCSNPMGHWDIPRGEGITPVTCSAGLGTTTYERKFSDMKPWEICGDMSTADVVGHTLVIHDPDSTASPPPAIACGKIVKQ